MDDAEKMAKDYAAVMRCLGPYSGVMPNYQQADPWDITLPGGPAGYTVRDVIGPCQGKTPDVTTNE